MSKGVNALFNAFEAPAWILPVNGQAIHQNTVSRDFCGVFRILDCQNLESQILCDMMEKYVCDACGYIYDPAEGDPEVGIAPGTAFSDLPEDWVCPVCGAPKDKFTVEE